MRNRYLLNLYRFRYKGTARCIRLFQVAIVCRRRNVMPIVGW